MNLRQKLLLKQLLLRSFVVLFIIGIPYVAFVGAPMYMKQLKKVPDGELVLLKSALLEAQLVQEEFQSLSKHVSEPELESMISHIQNTSENLRGLDASAEKYLDEANLQLFRSIPANFVTFTEDYIANKAKVQKLLVYYPELDMSDAESRTSRATATNTALSRFLGETKDASDSFEKAIRVSQECFQRVESEPDSDNLIVHCSQIYTQVRYEAALYASQPFASLQAETVQEHIKELLKSVDTILGTY